tara:strand:+ start:12427 stop:14064 length:1638 start_codon:yes stop_codon:yes gene_type:complete
MIKKYAYQLTIAFFAALLFIPFLGNVHLFDWDEINFAEAAREMLVTGNYATVQIDFMPFWEKPPLFFWFQALSMKLFGVNEFAARFPNAVCGIITLISLFNIGTKLKDENFGLLWVLAYVGSFLPFFYFKSGIIDPWFNYFIFMGIYFSAKKYLFPNTYKLKDVFISGVLIGLAVLTKGPVGALIYGLTVGVFLAFNKFKNFPTFKETGLFTLGLISFGSIWFIEELVNGRLNIIIEFIVYQIRLLKTQDAGHGGPFYYHFIVLIFGVFAASAYAFFAFFKEKKEQEQSPLQLFKRWMLILFWVVLILFSVVKTKIVHYSSMAYFPITFLGAYYAYELIVKQKEFSKAFKLLYLSIATIIGLAIIFLPFIAINKQAIIESGMIKDVFASENFKANVHWSGFEAVIGIIFLLGNYIIVFAKSIPVTKKIVASFLLTLFTVNIASVIITPKIEGYSQRAAIEFYQSFKGRDVYVYPLGFKSYAHLFYTDKQPQNSLKGKSIDWLLKEKIDKPAYFVCKITNADDFLKQNPLLEKIGEKNGYVFLKRK